MISRMLVLEEVSQKKRHMIMHGSSVLGRLFREAKDIGMYS